MTTNDSITAAQVEQLRSEAGEAGDAAQVALCEQAVAVFDRRNGWDSEDAKIALAQCVRAIQRAEAMVGEGA